MPLPRPRPLVVAVLVSVVATILLPSLAPATTALADETAPSVVVLGPAPPAGGRGLPAHAVPRAG